jgi:hypothetical protein
MSRPLRGLSLRASRSGCAPLRGAWLALLRSLSLLAASRLAICFE